MLEIIKNTIKIRKLTRKLNKVIETNNYIAINTACRELIKVFNARLKLRTFYSLLEEVEIGNNISLACITALNIIADETGIDKYDLYHNDKDHYFIYFNRLDFICSLTGYMTVEERKTELKRVIMTEKLMGKKFDNIDEYIKALKGKDVD